MKAQAALVGTERVVKLHAVAAVGAHISLLVLPQHAKHINAVGFGHALKDDALGECFVVADVGHHRFGDFMHRLMKLLLVRIAPHKPGHESGDVGAVV